MNKNEFIKEVYNQSGLSKKDCKLCLETILNVIRTALQSGESVSISNFGKFQVEHKKAKSLYNFQTKTTELVQAKNTPGFKASSNLKECLK